MKTLSKPRVSRRQLLKQLGLMGAGSSLSIGQLLKHSTAQAAPPQFKPRRMPMIKNRAPLVGNAFYFLPLGAIRPLGWLKNQLQIQANGLSGHLDEFWIDTSANGGWLGGPSRGLGGDPLERVPYYLDGLVPLAYQLDDDRLKAKVRRFVDWAIGSQEPSGMFGPSTPEDEWWPRIAMLKALTQYQEATGDQRVIPLMEKYFRFQSSQLDRGPLPDLTKYRWQDELLSVLWLYNRTGSSELLELARRLRKQGYDWIAQSTDFQYPGRWSQEQVPPRAWDPSPDYGADAHGVNVAQGLKTGPVWSLVSGSKADAAAAVQMVFLLQEYHGVPNGMYTCDEMLSGRNPSQGTELCSVVEYLFSLEQSLAITGDPVFGDVIEKVAFNALPAAFTEDMWARQYFQAANQVECSVHSKPWNSVMSSSPALFGVDSNDGCCTANFSQGWPKLTASLFLLCGSSETNEDEGLVAAAYAPCEVRAVIRGTAVHVVEETEYPFKGTVNLTINPASPLSFPLQLRIPAWAEGTQIRVNGQSVAEGRAGSFARIERTWKAQDRVELLFPMKARVSHWFQNSAAVERGPLVFSLPIGESWVKLRDNGPTAEWQVFPASQWNYALNLGPDSHAPLLEVTESSVGPIPFSRHNAPVHVTAKGRKLNAWIAEDGVANPPPRSPVLSDQPDETVALVPYACAKLRITAFPQYDAKVGGGHGAEVSDMINNKPLH